MALKLHSLKTLAPVKFDARVIKKLFFVSEDVVVFYPNVDIQKVHQIASNYLIDYCSSFGGEFDLD